jgi:hypothetical protein
MKYMTIFAKLHQSKVVSRACDSSRFFRAIITCGLLTGWDVLIGLYSGGASASASPPIIFSCIANGIVSGTLAFLAGATHWRGMRLGLAFATIPIAIAVVNLVEGVVYLNIEASKWNVISSVLKYIVVLPVWSKSSSRVENYSAVNDVRDPRGLAGTICRFGVSDFLYLVIYFAAGMVIFPLVRDFYATQTLPSVRTITALQLLFRAPVFMSVCVLLSVMIGGRRMKNSFFVGLSFTLVSGVAPLIVPNPFFPDSIRWIHFWEVTLANFAYGVLVAAIWWKRGRVTTS